MRKKQIKPRKKINAYDRVMNRIVTPLDKDQCWIWPGPVNNAGYGMIRGNDGIPKMQTVHRVVGEHIGLDPHKEIQHTCLTKNCVNPKHLVNGNAKSRYQRIEKKHGKHFKTPKQPYRTCPHCKEQTYVTYFSRKHSECYTYIPKNKV